MSKHLFHLIFLLLLTFSAEVFGQNRVFRGREAPDNEEVADPVEQSDPLTDPEVDPAIDADADPATDPIPDSEADFFIDPADEDDFEFSGEEDAASEKRKSSKSKKKKGSKKSKKNSEEAPASEESSAGEETAANGASAASGESVVTASDEDYSYSTDRAFHHPKDLLGYTFCPRVHIKDGIYKSLEKGRMAIIFTQNKLSFDGMEEVDSFYYISDISKNMKGFEVELLDMDKPSVPMLMMVYVDDYGFATKIKMITLERDIHEWTLPNRPKEEEVLLDEEYTNVFELPVTHYDSSLVGQTVVPWRFAEESPNGFGILTPEGKLSLVFEEDLITISGNELTESYEILKMTHYINTSGMERAVMIEAKVKPQNGKKSMMYIHLDEWSQIEVIRLGGYRFYLKP